MARIREQVDHFLEQRLRERSIEGVLPAHGAVLVQLFGAQAPVPVRELVRLSRRAKSTVSGMLTVLVRGGWVRRLPDARDARAQRVELTEQGRGLRGDFEAISRELQELVFADFTDRERELLATLLERVERNVQRHRDEMEE